LLEGTTHSAAAPAFKNKGMKKHENKFHQEYLQGKNEDEYRGSAKIIFWLVAIYGIAGILYYAAKTINELFFNF